MFDLNEFKSIVIRYIEVPSMIPEVDECGYIEFVLLNFLDSTIKTLNLEEIKMHYRQIKGRSQRIEYWVNMKLYETEHTPEYEKNIGDYIRAQIQ